MNQTYPTLQSFQWDLDRWLGSAERLAATTPELYGQRLMDFCLNIDPIPESSLLRYKCLHQFLAILAKHQKALQLAGLLSVDLSARIESGTASAVVYALYILVIDRGLASPLAEDIIGVARAKIEADKKAKQAGKPLA